MEANYKNNILQMTGFQMFSFYLFKSRIFVVLVFLCIRITKMQKRL
jgi:hypothetical protein